MTDHDFDVLRRIVMQERQIDLVKLGPFLNFMYTDDVSYIGLPAEVKNMPMSALEDKATPLL